MERPQLDFPHPDSPTNPNVSPCLIVNDTFSTACTLATSRWSEHTQANKFVDYAYYTYLNNQSNENKRLKKDT